MIAIRKDDFMNKLNKKQKLIAIAILIVSILSICYYIYGKGGTFAVDEDLEVLETAEVDENSEELNKKETIKVHISGAVNNEGLIELEKDSRIANAIEKAGGLKDEACIDEVNLAFVLEDGIKIKIPTKEEVEKQNKEALESSNSDAGQKYIVSETGNNQIKSNVSNSLVPREKVSNRNLKVNINTANQRELETLPGIGAVTALKVIDYRNEKGKFKSIEDIKGVSGIGEAKFDKIKELIEI